MSLGLFVFSLDLVKNDLQCGRKIGCGSHLQVDQNQTVKVSFETYFWNKSD